MKWSLISKMPSYNFWILQNDEKVIAELRYNIDSRSLRLHTSEKRLFFLEQTGIRQVRMLLTSEYNIGIGECYFKDGHSGVIILEEKKYSFHVQGDTLKLFSSDILVSSVLIRDLHALNNYEFSALLFGHCICNRITASKTSLVTFA